MRKNASLFFYPISGTIPNMRLHLAPQQHSWQLNIPFPNKEEDISLQYHCRVKYDSLQYFYPFEIYLILFILPWLKIKILYFLLNIYTTQPII